MNTLTLHTIQPQEVWDKLQAEKVLYTDPTHAQFHPNFMSDGKGAPCPQFQKSYDWMRDRMKEKVPNYTGHYPWWAWYGSRPDLRRERFTYTQGKREVLLRLGIPATEVVLSEFFSWSCVINGFYLATSESDDDAFEARWEEITGAKPPWFGRKEIEKDVRAKYLAEVEQSWHRIFDAAQLSDPEWHGSLEWQATFEALRLTDVKQATPFVGARKP